MWQMRLPKCWNNPVFIHTIWLIFEPYFFSTQLKNREWDTSSSLQPYRLKFGRPHNNPNDSIEQTKDYFERRLSTQKWGVLFDCQKSEQTYVMNSNLTRLNWQKLDYTNQALTLICQNHNQKTRPTERVLKMNNKMNFTKTANPTLNHQALGTLNLSPLRSPSEFYQSRHRHHA